MGKGGKKKNKPSEKDNAEPGSKSESQASTSQAPIEGVAKLNISDTKPDTSDPKEEEIIGLGFGGYSKKRNRKKKKDDTSAGDEQSSAPVQQMTGLTAAGPSQAFPKLTAGLGRGRGTIGNPPQVIPQTQVVPIQPIHHQVPVPTQVPSQTPWGIPQQTQQYQQQQQRQEPLPQQQQRQEPPPQQQQRQGPPPQQQQRQGPPPQQQQRQEPPPQQQQLQEPPQEQQHQSFPGLAPSRSISQLEKTFAQPTYSQRQAAGVGPGSGRGRGRGRGGAGRGDPTSAYERSALGESKPTSTSQGPNRLKIPLKRPGKNVASLSRPLKLITNYLEMSIKPLKIYRYDVSVKPEKPKKAIPKAFLAAKKIKFPNHIVAFDQRKNCYTLTPLWNTSDERMNISVEVLDDNKAKMVFEVTIKITGIVDTTTILQHMRNGDTSLNPPTEAIQAIDVILQQGALESYVKSGRQYFMRPKNPIDLFYGMEMWTGLFQSAIFTSRAFINIDVAHKAFPRQQSLIDALVKDFNLDPKRQLQQQRGYEYFDQFIKGLKVIARIGGGERIREYICNGLVDPANRLTFSVTDPSGKQKTLTVEKYFEVDKKCRLRYPYLNCVWVGPRDRNIYYPMEMLEIGYGQPINKQLNEKQLQTMVREAATPPNERLNKIKEVIRNMNYSANTSFKHFQLEVANKFFQVDGKVLQAPRLDVGTGRSIEPRKGVWQANRFLKASSLEAWGIITIEADPVRCQCQNFIDMVKRVGVQMGMPVRDPLMTNFSVRMNEIHKILLAAYEKRINILFVIVPLRYKDAYDRVKRMAELEVGILTQCIKEQTASRRMNEQTVRNILLKVNSKLMGINQGLEPQSVPECIKKGGVMMVGADVTHPPPDQKTIPSIAAVSASIDPKCFIYNIELSMQTPKEEIIVDFEDMMFDHLKTYRERQRMLPRKIYVFRDGVSEGQFAQVMRSELVAIEKAYYRLEQREKPEILFLLVQKRHHTRFFMGENSPQNVEPGTVVDTDIVHPTELDFYLVSHQAIKGTARPTRYHVICNDGNIPTDEVEQLAYYLCHLYARCTRAVSYPAPTYYAHLACMRARALTSGDRYNNAELEKKPKRLRVLDKMLQHSRMFFV